LPRRRHLLISSQNRDQRTEAEITSDHQIAADGIEEKRRKLGDEIVKEFYQKLAVVDLIANRVNSAENFGEPRSIIARPVVDPDLLNAGDRFADALGQPPNRT